MPTIPECPKVTAAVISELLVADDAGDYPSLVAFVADEIFPYCDGIDALLKQ